MHQTDCGKVIFSFVLPIYNVEAFLPDCLGSLLWQSFDHAYEIICVDDGSADSSKEVVRAYQKRYPNIRLVKKENGGVSSARNAGLKQAEGEYVWFVDPDDYIAPKCLAGIYAAFLRFPEAEMLYFNVREVAEDASPDGEWGRWMSALSRGQNRW